MPQFLDLHADLRWWTVPVGPERTDSDLRAAPLGDRLSAGLEVVPGPRGQPRTAGALLQVERLGAG